MGPKQGNSHSPDEPADPFGFYTPEAEQHDEQSVVFATELKYNHDERYATIHNPDADPTTVDIARIQVIAGSAIRIEVDERLSSYQADEDDFRVRFADQGYTLVLDTPGR